MNLTPKDIVEAVKDCAQFHKEEFCESKDLAKGQKHLRWSVACLTATEFLENTAKSGDLKWLSQALNEGDGTYKP